MSYTRVDLRILSSLGVQRWTNEKDWANEQKVWAWENTRDNHCVTEIRDGHADGQLLYTTKIEPIR